MKHKSILSIFFFSILIVLTLLIIRFVVDKAPMFYSNITALARTITPNAKSKKTFSNNLEKKIYISLTEMEVKAEHITSKNHLDKKVKTITVKIPLGSPLEEIVYKLQKCAKKTNFNIEDCSYNPKKGICTIIFKSKDIKFNEIRLRLSRTDCFFSSSAKIAFLIRNFTFKADETTVNLLSFSEPLTFSLQSTDPKLDWTAKAISEYKKEIVIDLPLESQRLRKKSGIILIHHKEDEIRKKLRSLIKTIPKFSGFSSLYATNLLDDSRIMKIVFDELSQHNGYFIYHTQYPNTIISKLSKEAMIQVSKITYSINADIKIAELTKLLHNYVLIAQKRNSMIISVEVSSVFINSLNNTLEFFEKNGISLVSVSTILSGDK